MKARCFLGLINENVIKSHNFPVKIKFGKDMYRSLFKSLKIPVKNTIGFTLIEVLIAIVIIAIVILPVTTILIKGTHSSRMVSKRQKAVFSAQEEMEKLLSVKGVVFSDSVYSVEQAKSIFYIKREVKNNQGLLTISIRVYQDTTEAPLAKLRVLTNQGSY